MGWFTAENVPQRKRSGATKRSTGGRAPVKENLRARKVPAGRAKKLTKAESDALHLRHRLLLKSAIMAISIVGLTASVGFGGRVLKRKLLLNELFALRRVDVRVGGDNSERTGAWVRSCLRIEKGQSIFAIDIEAKRKNFMDNAPSVKWIGITRVLPGRLQVDVMERVAVARLGRGTGFVADEEGVVFSAGPDSGVLPLVVAFREGGLKPGSRVQGVTLAAVQVAGCDNVAGMDLEVVEIDASKEDYVRIMTGQGKVVKLAWPKMGTLGNESRRSLEARMLAVSKTLRSPRGSTMMELDATTSDRMVIGSPGEG